MKDTALRYMIIYWTPDRSLPFTSFMDNADQVLESKNNWEWGTKGTADVYIWTGTRYQFLYN